MIIEKEKKKYIMKLTKKFVCKNASYQHAYPANIKERTHIADMIAPVIAHETQKDA